MGVRIPDDTVSAVIVNYNSGPFLKQCVELVLHQADEVIIVDNASSDTSLKILVAALPDEPHLKIIQNDKNLGFATACNIGTKQSTGNYILFLNPDCLIQPDAVSRLVTAFETDPKVGMAGGLLLNPDGTEQGGGRRAVPTPWRSFVRAFGLNRFADRWPRIFSDYYLHNQPLPDSPIEVEAISGAYTLVRRDAMDDVGHWDKGYFLHCEDLDLSMRFRQKGWKILFVPDAPVIHYMGICGVSNPFLVEWHKHRGMRRFYRKFFRHQYPGPLWVAVIAGVWLRFALICCYRGAQLFVSKLRNRRG